MSGTEDRQRFDTFGFVVKPQLFPAPEMDAISREFDAAMREELDGPGTELAERRTILDWFRGRPEAAYLETDPRIRGKVDELLGPENSLKDNNDGNLYVGDTVWHPDLGWDPAIPEGMNDPYRLAGNLTNHYRPSIKVAFYLDPVGRDSGCLRVIPGSHRNPYHDSLWSLHLDIPARARSYGHVTAKLLQMWERDTGSPEGGQELLRDPEVNVFGIPPAEVPAHAIESEPGDVVFFSHQLWHASFGGCRGRRMFTLNFLTS